MTHPMIQSGRRRVPVALLLSLALLALLATRPGPAFAAPVGTNATAESADPGAIVFKVHAVADSDLAAATLNYKVLSPDGNVGGTLRADVSGRSTDASATLQTNSSDRYIPVGTRFAYSWTITDKNGGSVTTQEQTFTFLDGRFPWQTKTEGAFTVYWYGANSANADSALQATSSSVRDNEALLGVKLNYPIRVVVYRNTADAKAAQRQRAASFDSQIITGGSRVAADILHIYEPLGDFVDVARHEAAHIVTKVAGDGAFTSLPSWIDEGTAVYAQNGPGFGYQTALQRAIQSDQLLRLRNMQSATNQPDLVNLFYGESWAVVKFMVDTYGREKFAAVFQASKGGAPMDDALQQVIGVDQDGLYNAYRKSVNLKTIDFPPVPKASAGGPQATQAPLGIPSGVKSADNTAGSAGVAGGLAAAGVTPTALAVGAGALVIAIGLGVVAFRLLRAP